MQNTYEAIEVTISWERCEELGVTDALEPELQLAVTARLEQRLDVGEVTTGFSGWDGVAVWDSNGDKMEPPGSVKEAVNNVIADEAQRLT